MDVIAAAKAYVNKMIKDSKPGMKILLMDKETTSFISMVFGRSEIQQKEIYLLQRLDEGPYDAPSLRYLKCLVLLRPTQQNIDNLRKELSNPRYGAYYIYFTNIISKADIKLLAEYDEQELVQEVQELYLDYLAVNPHLFSIGIPQYISGRKWHEGALQRTVQGIIALLLSLKKCPAIRYPQNSRMCSELARGIKDVLDKESSLFTFGNQCPPLLLILDRRSDPITPLLNQWTYQAMVHELLSINNNRVNLSKVPDVSKELSEVVLSAEHDAFYAKNIFLNFGEIGQNIKELMEQFQLKAKSNQKIENIADMKQFVESYPQFKKLSGDVAKHVTVMGELSRLVNKHHLLDVSEVEQEIATENEHSAHLQSVRKLLDNTNVRDSDAIKLVMLYALRYQKQSNNSKHQLLNTLKRRGIPEHPIRNVDTLLRYAESEQLQTDIFNMENAVQITKKFFKGLGGVENVFTRHKPLLHNILDDLQKGKLSELTYPYYSGGGGGIAGSTRHDDVIVFIVGGVMYEESFTVHQMNRSATSTSMLNVILGGTNVLNSESFLEQITHTSDK